MIIKSPTFAMFAKAPQQASNTLKKGKGLNLGGTRGITDDTTSLLAKVSPNLEGLL